MEMRPSCTAALARAENIELILTRNCQFQNHIFYDVNPLIEFIVRDNIRPEILQVTSIIQTLRLYMFTRPIRSKQTLTRTRLRPLHCKMASSTSMAVDPPTTHKPPKLVLDEFINTALTVTPQELHPYFEEFRKFYVRKCVDSLLHDALTQLYK
jgi:hypothetical protein